ncbi:hypothetical protein ES703_65124 [subsurface metagenome]
MTVRIFHYNDRVIHHYSQNKNERHEDDHVHRESDDGNENEGNDNGHRDGDPDKKGIRLSHKEHQDKDHYDEPEDNRVEQIIHAVLRLSAAVSCHGDDQTLGCGLAVFFNDCVDLIDSIDQVFSAFLDHVDRHHILGIQTGVAFPVRITVYDFGYFFKINPFFELDIPDLVDVSKFPDHTEVSPNAIRVYLPSRNGEILGGNRVLNGGEGKFRRLHFIQIDIDLDFSVQRSSDIRTRNLLQAFDLILKVFGDILQLHQAKVP